ncbi:inositol phosphatase [Kipferlia bialata]|uniref:Inositol phosphatase n=1 Tax=Kipferlia bialata TaxID=797122 RepID=A0A9K3CNL1_9EUKA|nr:inositol phosphatase [Kipferlia bialata]|eukprot:g1263.t1
MSEVALLVEGIKFCREHIIPQNESFLKGYVFISINQWNMEQERVVLLTDKAIYRVKYDFETKNIQRHESTKLTDITHIHRGVLEYPQYAFLSKMAQGVDERIYGCRIYSKEGSANGVNIDGQAVGKRSIWNPFQKHQSFRTFKALDSFDAQQGRDVTLEFTNLLFDSIRRADPESAVYKVESPINRSNVLGLVSVGANKAKMGSFKKVSATSQVEPTE